MFENLTTLLSQFDADETHGEWIVDRKSKGTPDDPIQFPFVNYGRVVLELEKAIYEFEEAHPEYGLTCYRDTLAASNIDYNAESMGNADVSSLDGKMVAALILGTVRAHRFCEGALLEFCDSGCVRRWLGRLKEIDNSNCQ